MEEEEKNKEFKQETGCLFYNFGKNKKAEPIITNIDIKKRIIGDIYSNIENYYGNNNLTENENTQRDSYGYYRHIFTKYFHSQLNKPVKNKNSKNKPKKLFQIYSKIHFGSFLNSASNFEGYKKIHKYEMIKKQLSKSKNFSFVKDPNTIKYKKLPLDLYLSEEDSLKIKDLISIRFMDKNEKNKNESLLKYSNNNRIFDNTIINFENNFYKLNNRKIYYINKKQINKKNGLKLNNQISNNNFTKSNNLIINTEENNKPRKKLTKKNFGSCQNLSELNNFHSNKNKKMNFTKQKLYNKTENHIFKKNRKNPVLLELDHKINNFSKFKTPNKSIKSFIKLTKHKSEIKLRKIDKLINKANLKADSDHIISDLRINGSKKNKKTFQKEKYATTKKKIRLLSLVENLKNIQRIAPMELLNHLYKEYHNKSKELIEKDLIHKKIDNINKSSEEGKLIKKKIDKKNNVINNFISKNQFEGIKLKNKYKKFDMIIDKINEENKAQKYNQTE